MTARTTDPTSHPLKPQPRNGPPFQLQGADSRDWFNENLGHRRGYGPMLFAWRCPFGTNGEPKRIDGIWYWVRKEENDSEN